MRVGDQLIIFTEVLYRISLNARILKSMAATRVCIRAHNFATIRHGAKVLTLPCSGDIQLSNVVNNSFSTKCGEWLVYAELVTYIYVINKACL